MKQLAGLAAAFALGIGFATVGHLVPSVAKAAGMQMAGMSAPDMQMQDAMQHMNASMKTMHMTGNTDRDFITMMIPHHEAAIGMAKVELHYGKKPEVKSLARGIIAAQAKEIAQMRGWLQKWYRK
ncbi:MAG: DUF305 domain-containing protein [Candidatus Baltobacteraceae bacterium]